MSEILVPIVPADLIDRLTRLQLRSQHVNATPAQALLLHQITQLQKAADHALPADAKLQSLWHNLAEVNADLFALDADIRRCAERLDFGPGFVALTQAAIATQDSRIRIKQEINQLLASVRPTSGVTAH